MNHLTQFAIEQAAPGLLDEHAVDTARLIGVVEGPVGRVYARVQDDSRSAAVAHLAWGGALRELRAGRVPPMVDRALASLVIARAERGEVPEMAARRIVATSDVVFETLRDGRRQACEIGRGPL